jgi:O-acetyl-ADP-ribose deacetylase (regulator of RNase III)
VITVVETRVIWGDITQTPADAILTTIHPNVRSIPLGSVEIAIHKQVGDLFRQQLFLSEPLRNRQVVHATVTADMKPPPFKSVLYVVDDRTWLLNDLVHIGLADADAKKLRHVSMPLLHTGHAPRLIIEGSAYKEAIEAQMTGLKMFYKRKPRHIKKVTIVVYGYKNHHAIPFIQDFLKQF